MADNTINDAGTMRPGGGAALGRIDKYELVRELGEGGFGAVYLAKDAVAKTDVAIKGLPPEVKHNNAELEGIRANFALVKRLRHPNIVAVTDLHLAQSVSYASKEVEAKLRVFPQDTMVVMDYAPGVTLAKWRKQFPDGKVPLDSAVSVVRQVASALDYAHVQKVLHRDVKPANIMVETGNDGSLTARVLDFGLAAEIRSSMGRVSREIRDTSGTRPYMAPEQWLGKKQGPTTDQYALAVIFYELVVGEVPFASVFDCGDPAVMRLAVTTDAPEVPEELPKKTRLALAKALAKKPEERFASCSEFVDALEGKVKVSRRGAETRSGGIGTWKVLGALVLLAALGAGGHYGWTKYSVQKRAGHEPPPAMDIASSLMEPPSSDIVLQSSPCSEDVPSESALREGEESPVKDGPVLECPVSEEAPPPPPPQAALTVPGKRPAPTGTPVKAAEPAAEPTVVHDQQPIVEQKTEVSAVVDKEPPIAPVQNMAPVQKELRPIDDGHRVFTVKDMESVDPGTLRPGESRDVKLAGGVVVALNWCPPGSFSMSSPLKTVQIKDGFWIGRYEVTQDVWGKVMKGNPSRFKNGDASQLPVESVSRDDCLGFVGELNRQNGTSRFRLPLDEEWEYACRAETMTLFNYGVSGESGKMRCRGKMPCKVGSYEPNGWGLFDMHGNVAEWCMDAYPDELLNVFQRQGYILRGGSYTDKEANCSSVSRRREASHKKHPTFGVRLCFSAK